MAKLGTRHQYRVDLVFDNPDADKYELSPAAVTDIKKLCQPYSVDISREGKVMTITLKVPARNSAHATAVAEVRAARLLGFLARCYVSLTAINVHDVQPVPG